MVSRTAYLRTVTAGTITASEEQHALRKKGAINARFVKKPRDPEKDPSRRDTD
ncbi:hypothetical protein [Klebsiella sp. WOUb02]|uniref:hypothetical protein n=1 Tax=Klebsiella sp. WOUb02 TaxID=3161071 RepID=UPI003CF1D751